MVSFDEDAMFINVSISLASTVVACRPRARWPTVRFPAWDRVSYFCLLGGLLLRLGNSGGGWEFLGVPLADVRPIIGAH